MTALSCSNKDIDDTPKPPQGDFAVKITNPSLATKAATSAGEADERKINDLTLFLFETGTTTCVMIYPFTDAELVRDEKVAIFSLPKEITPAEKYDFYAIANYEHNYTMGSETIPANLPTPADLIALTVQEPVSAPTTHAGQDTWLKYYNKATYNEITTGAGFVINPNGKGFLMSGTHEGVKKKDTDAPRNVTIPIDRAACKFIVTAALHQDFVTNYQGPYQSTIKITDVIIENVYSSSYAFKPAVGTDLATVFPTAKKIYTQTAMQQGGDFPLLTLKTGVAPTVALMYGFENSVATTPASGHHAKITIKAKYDFDGPAGGQDWIDVTYDPIIIKGDGAVAGADAKIGQLSRNSQYTINVQVKGLSAQQIIANITINDWNVVTDQDVEFGG